MTSGGTSPGSLERGVLGGLAAFRWLALAWLVVVLALSRHDLGHPAGALALVAIAFAWTVAATLLVRHLWRWLLSPLAIAGEVAIGWALLAGDGWVYRRSHTQALASVWPLAGVLAAGVAGGPVAGACVGALLGTGRWAGAAHASWHGRPSVLSLVSTTVLYAVAGAAAGLVVRRLQAAEAEISAVRAREEVARTLHDGVLQTLAVVQRRSGDPSLATLARDQERELRDYLFGVRGGRPGRDGGADPAGGVGAPDDLLAALRHAATRFERAHQVRAEVSATEEPPPLPPDVVAAVAGAVAEALTNAAKHGDATRVVVFVDVDDHHLFCSVKDDGRGFDPAATPEGIGLTRSVRGRLSEVGGTVEVDSRPGRGADLRMSVPV